MSALQIILGAAALYALYNSGLKKLEDITWSLQKVRLSDVRVFQGGYDMRVNVSNNANFSIKLLGYAGTVSRNGEVIGEINSTGAIELPANSKTTIQAFVKLRPGALNQLQDILDGGGLLNAPITVDSYLKTTLIDIPIRSTFEFLKVS